MYIKHSTLYGIRLIYTQLRILYFNFLNRYSIKIVKYSKEYGVLFDFVHNNKCKLVMSLKNELILLGAVVKIISAQVILHPFISQNQINLYFLYIINITNLRFEVAIALFIRIIHNYLFIPYKYYT